MAITFDGGENPKTVLFNNVSVARVIADGELVWEPKESLVYAGDLTIGEHITTQPRTTLGLDRKPNGWQIGNIVPNSISALPQVNEIQVCLTASLGVEPLAIQLWVDFPNNDVGEEYDGDYTLVIGSKTLDCNIVSMSGMIIMIDKPPHGRHQEIYDYFKANVGNTLPITITPV